MLCRRLSSAQMVLDIDSYSGVLEAKERLEEEDDPGSVGDPSEFGSAERYLRDGTGGSSCDGGDVSGGVIIDRENEGWRESEGRSTSFFRQGRTPVVSVMPLGRVCGRGPSVVLLADRPEVLGIGIGAELVVAGPGVEMSFIDIFRVRAAGLAPSTSGCFL